MNNNKGFITFSVIFEAMSLNRDEGLGNIQSLHLLTRGNGDVYSYMSRQALTFAVRKCLIESREWKETGVSNKSVSQYDGDIADYEEIDLFGYMKTDVKTGEEPGKEPGDEDSTDDDENDAFNQKTENAPIDKKSGKGKGKNKGKTEVRPAAVTFTHALSMEPYGGDIAFYANPEMARRKGPGATPNPFNRQEHKSLYKYSVVIDLNRVSKKDNDDSQDPGKARKRLEQLLDAVGSLHHQIAAYREPLYPLFIAAAHIKFGSPLFHNYLELGRKKDEYGKLDGELLQKGLNHGNAILKEGKNKALWALLEGSGDLHLGMEPPVSDGREKVPMDVIAKMKEWLTGIYPEDKIHGSPS